MSFLRIFEPEETAGKIWHEIANRIAAEPSGDTATVSLEEVRTSLALLFRALGGAHDVEIVEAAPVRADHRRRLRRRLSQGTEMAPRPGFNGARLRLPAAIGCFDTSGLNKAAYLWLAATAAIGWPGDDRLVSNDAPPAELDRAYLYLNLSVVRGVLAICPGLQRAYMQMCQSTLERRVDADPAPSIIEQMVRDHLAGRAVDFHAIPVGAQALRIPPVPFWLDAHSPEGEGLAAGEAEAGPGQPRGAVAGQTRQGQRRDLDQANRKDSLIIHRFESILSWTESMDINRAVEDDDEENAKKAADDQDSVTLSRHDRKTASRLHLHLDLSPSEAEHERLAGKHTYPEWNHRSQAYMSEHCRVLEAEATVPESVEFLRRSRNVDRVRRQFEVLRTRRITETRQTDGTDLDLDALISARADLQATGRSSDRIYTASRKSRRDLSVGLLLDMSRSTEADMDGSCVIDVSRRALYALAHGLDACGDRFGIWGFSSLKRSRVFVTRCKGFEDPMSPMIDKRLAALQPGQYTRLGAAIRHVSALLVGEPSAQKLLLVITDGKPNDLDHYEGKHGVEDSRMAVRETRRQGMVVHGIVIDEDRQDWFPRIFGRGGFTLLPRPERLTRALPEIFRSLTQEF